LAARVAFPAVQWILVTRDMDLVFLMYMYNYIQIFCACSGSCLSLKV
jgi:hypothetical protein